MTAKHPPRGRLVAPLVVAVLLLIVGLGGCAIPGLLNGSLAYSVEPHAGGVTAGVHDQRGGTHTTWIVATNPPSGAYPIWLQVSGEGDVNVTRSVQLPAGNYEYVVYSAEGSVALGDATWRSGKRVGQGEVTVP